VLNGMRKHPDVLSTRIPRDSHISTPQKFTARPQRVETCLRNLL
jgi:hypothetical protein